MGETRISEDSIPTHRDTCRQTQNVLQQVVYLFLVSSSRTKKGNLPISYSEAQFTLIVLVEVWWVTSRGNISHALLATELSIYGTIAGTVSQFAGKRIRSVLRHSHCKECSVLSSGLKLA